jgi:hypothetical protein
MNPDAPQQPPLVDQPPDPAAAAVQACEARRLVEASRGVTELTASFFYVVAFTVLVATFRQPTTLWTNCFVLVLLGGMLFTFSFNRVVRRHRLRKGIVATSQLDATWPEKSKLFLFVFPVMLIGTAVSVLDTLDSAGKGLSEADFSPDIKYVLVGAIGLAALYYLVKFAYGKRTVNIIKAGLYLAVCVGIFLFPVNRADFYLGVIFLSGVVQGAKRHWRWRRWVQEQTVQQVSKDQAEVSA